MTEPDQGARTLGDRYVLVEQLAADDRRAVWRGHDDIASRPVVAKIFTAVGNDDAWRDAFDRGAQRLEALTHPGIATVLSHGAREPDPWLVSASVDGDRVDQILEEDGELSCDDALAVVGQTAMAVKAAHDAGIAHGAIAASHIVVRQDGSSALIGFEVPTDRRTADDLTALAGLARELVPVANATEGEVAGFLRWIEGATATDAGEIGRTALALAASVRGAHSTSVVAEPSATETTDEDDDEADPQGRNRAWYDDAERKRVRNGLIAIGATVVIAGAALLWLVERGGNNPTQVTVPSVVNLPLTDAQNQLIQDALRANEDSAVVPANGYVVKQFPPAGSRVKVGTVVILTVSGSRP